MFAYLENESLIPFWRDRRGYLRCCIIVLEVVTLFADNDMPPEVYFISKE